MGARKKNIIKPGQRLGILTVINEYTQKINKMKEKDITKQTHLSLSEQIRILGEGGGKEEPCPICGGDGIAVCNNPDHGFIHGGLGGNELARLGCPCCGHDPEHKIKGEKCEYCNGVGKVKQPEPIEDYPVYS